MGKYLIGKVVPTGEDKKLNPFSSGEIGEYYIIDQDGKRIPVKDNGTFAGTFEDLFLIEAATNLLSNMYSKYNLRHPNNPIKPKIRAEKVAEQLIDDFLTKCYFPTKNYHRIKDNSSFMKTPDGRFIEKEIFDKIIGGVALETLGSNFSLTGCKDAMHDLIDGKISVQECTKIINGCNQDFSYAVKIAEDKIDKVDSELEESTHKKPIFKADIENRKKLKEKRKNFTHKVVPWVLIGATLAGGVKLGYDGIEKIRAKRIEEKSTEHHKNDILDRLPYYPTKQEACYGYEKAYLDDAEELTKKMDPMFFDEMAEAIKKTNSKNPNMQFPINTENESNKSITCRYIARYLAYKNQAQNYDSSMIDEYTQPVMQAGIKSYYAVKFGVEASDIGIYSSGTQTDVLFKGGPLSIPGNRATAYIRQADRYNGNPLNDVLYASVSRTPEDDLGNRAQDSSELEYIYGELKQFFEMCNAVTQTHQIVGYDPQKKVMVSREIEERER